MSTAFAQEKQNLIAPRIVPLSDLIPDEMTLHSDLEKISPMFRFTEPVTSASKCFAKNSVENDICKVSGLAIDEILQDCGPASHNKVIAPTMDSYVLENPLGKAPRRVLGCRCFYKFCDGKVLTVQVVLRNILPRMTHNREKTQESLHLIPLTRLTTVGDVKKFIARCTKVSENFILLQYESAMIEDAQILVEIGVRPLHCLTAYLAHRILLRLDYLPNHNMERTSRNRMIHLLDAIHTAKSVLREGETLLKNCIVESDSRKNNRLVTQLDALVCDPLCGSPIPPLRPCTVAPIEVLPSHNKGLTTISPQSDDSNKAARCLHAAPKGKHEDNLAERVPTTQNSMSPSCYVESSKMSTWLQKETNDVTGEERLLQGAGVFRNLSVHRKYQTLLASYRFLEQDTRSFKSSNAAFIRVLVDMASCILEADHFDHLFKICAELQGRIRREFSDVGRKLQDMVQENFFDAKSTISNAYSTAQDMKGSSKHPSFLLLSWIQCYHDLSRCYLKESGGYITCEIVRKHNEAVHFLIESYDFLLSPVESVRALLVCSVHAAMVWRPRLFASSIWRALRLSLFYESKGKLEKANESLAYVLTASLCLEICFSCDFIEGTATKIMQSLWQETLNSQSLAKEGLLSLPISSSKVKCLTNTAKESTQKVHDSAVACINLTADLFSHHSISEIYKYASEDKLCVQLAIAVGNCFRKNVCTAVSEFSTLWSIYKDIPNAKLIDGSILARDLLRSMAKPC